MKRRKRFKNVVPVAIAIAFLAGTALWQFYAFVTHRNTLGIVDLQGGEHHLWWAIGFGLIACLAAFMMFSIFLRYDRNDELHITSPPPPPEMIL